MRFPDREDERVRFGREPAGLEETEYLGSLVSGSEDEYPVPLHPECIRERDGAWHLALPYADEREAENAEWRGIGCDPIEGILLPGPPVRRVPTCICCYQRWRTDALNA